MSENPEYAFGGTRPMLELIETIYAAVQQPELWNKVMEDMSTAIHGQSITMWARLPEDEIVAMARISEQAWSNYVQYYGGVNKLGDACDVKFVDGEVRYSHVAMTHTEFRRTEFCNDFFLPNDMYHSMGLKIPLKNLPAIYLSCQRPDAMGEFNATEGLVYETLMPHLQRALSLRAQNMQMQANVLGLETALDAYEHAVIGVDAAGRNVFCNPSAEKHLSRGTGLAVKEGRLVCTTSAACNAKLQGLLKREAGSAYGLDRHADGPSTLSIERGEGQSALQVTVFPFQAVLAGQSARLAALVFVSDTSDTPRSRAATLRALFALTPTEARVADLLAAGMDVREVSVQMRITLETARFHVKRVLAKTGARRQSELMRLMLGLPGAQATQGLSRG